MKRLVPVIIKAVKKFLKIKEIYDDARIAAYSARAAYFVLLSAVPLTVLAVTVAGTVVSADSVEPERILLQIFTADAAGYILELLNTVAYRSAVPIVSAAMLFLLWAATKGIRSIADGINNIFESGTGYNIVQLTVRSVLYTFVMFGVFAVSVVVLVFASPLETLVTVRLGEGADIVLTVLNMRNIILFFAFSLLFALAYRTLAKSDISFKNQLPGGCHSLGRVDIVFFWVFGIYKIFLKLSGVVWSLWGGNAVSAVALYVYEYSAVRRTCKQTDL